MSLKITSSSEKSLGVAPLRRIGFNGNEPTDTPNSVEACVPLTAEKIPSKPSMKGLVSGALLVR